MRNPLRLRRALLLASLSLACHPGTNRPADKNAIQPVAERSRQTDTRRLSQLAEAQKRWLAHGVTSYRLTGRVSSAFDDQPFDITVNDGTIVEAWVGVSWEHRPLDHAEAGKYIPDGLFASVSETLRNRVVGQEIAVIYDRSYDFPRTVETSFPGVTDGFGELKITSFAVK